MSTKRFDKDINVIFPHQGKEDSCLSPGGSHVVKHIPTLVSINVMEKERVT